MVFIFFLPFDRGYRPLQYIKNLPLPFSQHKI